MKQLLLYACVLIVMISAIVLVLSNPVAFVVMIGSSVGTVVLYLNLAVERDFGKPPVHKPRTKLPDDYRG